MEELREKAKKSIVLKKPATEEEEDKHEINHPVDNDTIEARNLSGGVDDSGSGNPQTALDLNGKRDVSESIKKSNHSESPKDKDVKHKRSKHSKSRHKDSKHRRSRHKSSRHRSSSKHKKRRRHSSVSSSSDASGSDSRNSDERRRKRKKHHKSRRRHSSSESSRGRHRSSRYRRSRKHKRHSSSSSSSSSSSDGHRKRSKADVIADKKSHPYFSRMSKLRRDRLNKEKKERFWDGFQWVSKESLELASKDPTIGLRNKDPSSTIGEQEEKIVTGKDLRRVVATNLPLDYGIDHEDLGNYLITKCKENGDDVLFRTIFLNTEHNSGVLECMKKEMTDFVIKLEGVKLLGNTLHFTKVADEKGFIHGGDTDHLLQDSAQLTAQAAAIVSSRIRSLQGKESGSNLNLMGDSFSTTKQSRIIKISNVFDRYSEMTAQQFEDIYEDMEEEMLRFGQPKRIKIIRNGEQFLGGEVGSVFVEFDEISEATQAKDALKGRVYDGREIKIIFSIDPDLLQNGLKIKDEEA